MDPYDRAPSSPPTNCFAVDDPKYGSLRSALAAATAAGGGEVILPPRTEHLGSSSLSITSPVTISGAGPLASVITAHSSTEVIDIALSASGAVTFRDIGITQEGTGNGIAGVDPQQLILNNVAVTGPETNSGIGVYLTRRAHANIGFLDWHDVFVQNWGGNGIDISNPIVSTLKRVISQNNSGDGFSLHGVTSGAAGTSVSLISCYANANAGHGYNFNTMAYCSLIGCAADDNEYGYSLTACQSVTLVGCGAEATINDSFVLTGGYGNSLLGCWVYTNKHYGIYVTGSETAASIIGAVENSPSGATAFIVSDSGTSLVIINDNNVTANLLASGTATTLGDASGEMSIAGPLYGNAIAHFYKDIDVWGPTAIAATAGAASSLPRRPAGYLEIEVNGTPQKIPYYGI